jgi:hypothetical protein
MTMLQKLVSVDIGCGIWLRDRVNRNRDREIMAIKHSSKLC